MIRSMIQLNDVIITNKVKIFDTNHGMLIGHVEQSDKFDSTGEYTNTWNMYDVKRSTMIRNLYPIEDMDGQSFRSILPKSEQSGTSSDFVKQYNADNLGYNSMTQIGNYGFMLSDETIEGLRELSYGNGGYFLRNQPTNVYVYPPSGDITITGDDGDYDSLRDGSMIPLYNLSGVAFNYLTELDGNNIYSDYINPTFYVNHTNTKSYLNANWDTGSMVTETTSGQVESTLLNTRSYNKIGSSMDSVFMTYRYDTDYDSDPVDISGDRDFNDYSMDSLSASTVLTDIPMNIKDDQYYTPGEAFAKRFEYLESIDVNRVGGLSKYATQSVHKSNVYSINIQNANINTLDIDGLDVDEVEMAKNRIKQSISNIIKDMIESCTPVNTQLAKIYWSGD